MIDLMDIDWNMNRRGYAELVRRTDVVMRQATVVRTDGTMPNGHVLARSISSEGIDVSYISCV